MVYRGWPFSLRSHNRGRFMIMCEGRPTESPIPRWLRFVLTSVRAGSAWYIVSRLLRASAGGAAMADHHRGAVWWIIGPAGLWLDRSESRWQSDWPGCCVPAPKYRKLLAHAGRPIRQRIETPMKASIPKMHRRCPGMVATPPRPLDIVESRPHHPRRHGGAAASPRTHRHRHRRSTERKKCSPARRTMKVSRD